jgi:hypothetical protein
MTKTGTSKAVDQAHAFGRLKKALAFHQAAILLLANINTVRDPDIVVANVILSAIAYTDALTAAYIGRINQKDHSAAVKLLRDALQNQLPSTQERRLSRLLGRKDETSYGVRTGRTEDAWQMVEHLDQFGDWAKETLTSRGISIAFPNDVSDDQTAREI